MNWNSINKRCECKLGKVSVRIIMYNGNCINKGALQKLARSSAII